MSTSSSDRPEPVWLDNFGERDYKRLKWRNFCRRERDTMKFESREDNGRDLYRIKLEQEYKLVLDATIHKSLEGTEKDPEKLCEVAMIEVEMVRNQSRRKLAFSEDYHFVARRRDYDELVSRWKQRVKGEVSGKNIDDRTILKEESETGDNEDKVAGQEAT